MKLKEEIFRRRMDAFMKYINVHEIPNATNSLKFSEIETDGQFVGNLDGVVYTWIVRQQYVNFSGFFESCFLYQNVYPIAYQKMKKRFETLSKKLKFSEKVKLVMEYVDDKNRKIPHGRSTIRFCDLKTGVLCEDLVGVFIQTQTAKNLDSFLAECSKYQTIFPNAYQKFQYKFQKRNSTEYYTMRIELLMKWCNQNEIPVRKNNLSFYDMDNSFFDYTIVSGWLQNEIVYHLEKLQEKMSQYKECYPIAYQKIASRIASYKGNTSKKMLTHEERMELLFYYCNDHDVPLEKSNLRFCDIQENIEDDSLVGSWLIRQLLNHFSSFVSLIHQYEKVYPISYEKIKRRIVRFHKIQQARQLSTQEKIAVFMEYVEQYGLSAIDKNLRFCDLRAGIEDSSSVVSWFRSRLSRDLSNFINEYQKYITIYPTAYQEIGQTINNSSVRKKRQRILLMQQLANMRDSLLDNVAQERYDTTMVKKVLKK